MVVSRWTDVTIAVSPAIVNDASLVDARIRKGRGMKHLLTDQTHLGGRITRCGQLSYAPVCSISDVDCADCLQLAAEAAQQFGATAHVDVGARVVHQDRLGQRHPPGLVHAALQLGLQHALVDRDEKVGDVELQELRSLGKRHRNRGAACHRLRAT